MLGYFFSLNSHGPYFFLGTKKEEIVENLTERIECEFDENVGLVYADDADHMKITVREISQKEIDNLKDFDGF